jgi:hypothetical protein
LATTLSGMAVKVRVNNAANDESVITTLNFSVKRQTMISCYHTGNNDADVSIGKHSALTVIFFVR